MKYKFLIPAPILATLIVPVGIFAVLAPYSLLLGFNLFTAIIFWFLMVPALASYLPLIFLKSGNHFIQSLAGLIFFYLFMVWMIYKHYQTDLFKVMMASAVFNVILITLIGLSKKFLNKPV